MSSFSRQRTEHASAEEKPENLSAETGPSPFFEASNAQDFSIPPQLLHATGNIGSVRDREGSLTWAPQPSLPFEQLSGSLKRHGTRASRSPERTFSISPLSATWERVGSSPYRTLSYIPGSNDVITTTPRESRSATRDRSGPPSSIWTTADPFSTSKESVNNDPEQMFSQTRTRTRSRPRASRSAMTDNAQEEQVRRGTLQSIVGAIVPDAVQRRLTNASYARRSSMWHIYEKAKERGVQLQRNRFAQTAFEYGIYAVLILLIYFVLIGVPLWKGSVYWLWWVVANKFVIAGGFSITLGIALL
jgi:hypothetical protein